MKPQSSWKESSVPVSTQPEDPESKKQVKINKIAVEDDLLGSFEEQFSRWLKMKRIIALVQKWKISTEQKKKMMPTRSKKIYFSNNNLKPLDVIVLQEAKKCVVKILSAIKYFN